VVLAGSPALAATTLVYDHVAEAQPGEPAPAPSTDTVALDGQRLRVEQSAPAGGGRGGAMAPNAIIFDAAAKKVWLIQNDKKTYTELTEADIKDLRDRMQSMRGMMAEHMKNLPPEQRARMERMMNGQGPDLKFAAKGQKKTINGFACEMYDVTMDGKPFQESCIAPWGTGPFTKDDADKAKALFTSLASMMKGMPGAGVQHMASYPGVPVQTTHLNPAMGGTGKWTQTLKSVSRAAIPASQFQVPAGYTKQPLPTMGGPGMGHGMGPGNPHGGPPATGNPHGGPPGHAEHH
jgi:hypothetical protein